MGGIQAEANLSLGFLFMTRPRLDMLYIISRSTTQGRSAGVASCLGIATGGLLQTTAVAFGISGVFLVVPIAYDILKYGGAAYLVYLGIRFILSREGERSVPLRENRPAL
jgi:threonine/homoserine/homoserine lactone efflux protein